MVKTSITSQNIKAINRHLNTLAKNFGTESKIFQDYTNKLEGLDLYDRNGVQQIRNTQANRIRHQQLSAVRRHPVNISETWKELRAKYGTDGIDFRGETPKQERERAQGYIRLRLEVENKYEGEDLYGLEELCDKYGIEHDYMRAYRERDYVAQQWERVAEAYAEEMEELYESSSDSYAENPVDPETGEVNVLDKIYD